jgi:hypothetical protein
LIVDTALSICFYTIPDGRPLRTFPGIAPARTTLSLAASIIRRAVRIVPVMRIGYLPPANAG